MSTLKKTVKLEVGQNTFDVYELAEKAEKDYKKNNKESVKNFNVYIKPEDNKVYYTVNDDKFFGSVDM